MEHPMWIWVFAIFATQVIADPSVSVDADGFIAFNHLDSDHNGYVSRVEARSVQRVEAVFDSVDANSDGLLNYKEYTSVRSARKAD